MGAVVGQKIPNELKVETSELKNFFCHLDVLNPDAPLLIQSQLDHFQNLTKKIDKDFGSDIKGLRQVQEWFRLQTNSIFFESDLFKRLRTWPEGYQGDCVTLDMIYDNREVSESLLGRHLDRYLLNQNIFTALRSRMYQMTQILIDIEKKQSGSSKWMSLACGSCRELLKIPPSAHREYWFLDQDAMTIEKAQGTLENSGHLEASTFINESVYHFMEVQKAILRSNEFNLIYSLALFDYVRRESFQKLVAFCYKLLKPNGVLVMPYQDKDRYETFYYHWLTNWYHFVQRNEKEVLEELSQAGLPMENLEFIRDDSGIILFVIAHK